LSLIRQRSRVEMAEMMLDLIGNLSDCVLFLAFLSAFFLNLSIKYCAIGRL